MTEKNRAKAERRLIDGDATFDPMPRFERALGAFRQDRIDGDIECAHDLDKRFTATVGSGLEAMAEPPATHENDAGS